MQRIFIVFPRGDKTKLCFGIGFDYERDDWSLASRQDFSYDEDGIQQALEYGRQLANSHNLPLDVSAISEGNRDYLD
jgi:hypothetical protein